MKVADACCPACGHAAEHADDPELPAAEGEFVSERLELEVLGEGLVVPIDGRVCVGRAKDCEVVLGGSTLSRRQFVVMRAGREITVTDLMSSCGTYVNGRAIRDKHPVHPGDEIRAGEYVFRVRQS